MTSRHSFRATNKGLSGLLVCTLVPILLISLLQSGCSSAKKTTPELSEMRGKKVALISIDGEESARRITEVALVNQLVRHGSFILLSKEEVRKARTAAAQDPMDWIGMAKRAGADIALRIKVLKFDADTREGYSSEVVNDPQLEAERGDGKTERLFKVRSLAGEVQYELEFAHLNKSSGKPEIRKAVAEIQDEVRAEARDGAAHLPPALRYLETLSNRAFSDFFEKYD